MPSPALQNTKQNWGHDAVHPHRRVCVNLAHIDAQDTGNTVLSEKRQCDSTYMRDLGKARSEIENTMVARRVCGGGEGWEIECGLNIDEVSVLQEGKKVLELNGGDIAEHKCN